MSDTLFTMLDEGNITILDKDLQEFKKSIRGDILFCNDPGYEEARAIWNAMIERHPAMIVRCSGVADVIATVNFARNNTIMLSVKGGGHSAAGNALCEGGITIDLSRMKSVFVDPIKQTAKVQGGATWGDLDHETQAFGLAVTGGTVSDTGIGGLTLGGGLGWLFRKYGLSSDNLLSVEIVTADGKLMSASESENADLFWGVRGGGGNFGVVTAFEYRLHPVSMILGGMIMYPIERAKEILRLHREFTFNAPDELSSQIALIPSPQGMPVVGVLVGYFGDMAEGEKAIKPLEAFGEPLMKQVGPMPYTVLQSMMDAGFRAGMYSYWKSHYIKDKPSDEMIDIIVDEYAKNPSPLSGVILEHAGGFSSHLPNNATAYNHRSAPYNFLIIGRWAEKNAEMQEKTIRWVRELFDTLKPFSTGGVYVNYLGEAKDEGIDRLKAAYGEEKYNRLVELKTKYDPTNLFRINQNIKPTIS